MSDSDVLTYARISAHSGIDIVFNKEANKLTDTSSSEGSKYGDGFYDWKNNRIVVNPESKRGAESLLIHELDHAVRGYFGKDATSSTANAVPLPQQGRLTKVFKEAIEGVDQATRDKITREYKKVALPGELASTVMDETNAYYAEKALTNKNTLEKIVEAEPGLKDKILSFFKGAAADYADVPKLSGSAKWYYKKFKKMFDEFSARNAQSNAKENTLTSMNQENMQVSDRQYAVLGDIEGQINNYQKRLDAWDKTTEGFAFVMGETPSYLSEMTVGDKKIGKRQVRIDASKMKKIIKDHPEMSVDVLKQLPYLLNDPVLVMDSKTVSGRLVLLGDVYANGKVVSMILEINPSTRSGKTTYVNVMKVASAHTRSNLQNLINSSNIRYVTENKNRVNEWLKVNRLQLPLPNSHSDSAIDSIPQPEQKSNSSDEISLENSSDKQYALDIDSEGENISGAEVMS